MLFIFIRISTFFASMNVIFPKGTPTQFKVLFSFVLSMIVSFGIDASIDVNNMYELVSVVITEFMTGLMLGYITSLCFSALQIAGSFIDLQLGLSMASMFDPNTQSQTTIIQNIMYWMGVVIFFAINGHHVMIEGIQYSFNIIKVGQFVFVNNFEYIINVFVQIFSIGFRMSIPIMLALFMKDLVLGLISKSVPSLNIMMISMPLKILVGIAFFIISVPLLTKEIIELIGNISDILKGTLSSNYGILAPIGIILSNDDKTEEPTAKKKRDARKQGNVAKSSEVQTAVTLISMLAIIMTMSEYVFKELRAFLIGYLNYSFKFEMNDLNLNVLMEGLASTFAKTFLPIGAIIMSLGVIATLVQTKLLFTTEPLKPKLSKLNPISGLKNMFSGKAIVQLLKSIVIIAILFYIGEKYIEQNFRGIMMSSSLHISSLFPTVVTLISDLLKKMVVIVVVIAALDYGYQRYTHNKSLKMTKEEIKEEFKQAEGNPQIKGKIKQKQREMARMRMMQAVPTANVIVTNPTHISIAIRYERGKDETPVVVAKGADLIAFKIREIAKEHDIPIIENKPLARLMYKEVEIDQEIPESMYQAVAEVLVAVYKIKNRYKKL